MCKLNLFCKQPDGHCTCHQKNTQSLSTSKPHSGLLCSILSFIKDQPQILESLSKASNIPIESVLSSFSSMENPTNSFPSSSIKENTLEVSDFQVNILSDIPNRVVIGKGFSMMAEIVDKNLVKIDFKSPETFQVVVVGKNDGLDKLVVGEIETSGVAFFRKLVVNEEISDCSLVVRIKGKSEITQFCQDIEIRSKTSKKIIKRMKTQEILA
ncbi:hypothetical protein SteCoe_10041 [Stentor coeruleus]|uniref:Uncharacterized protein n=1 Tax=Stentor coeruleus TaxID=5963 RepID=A0A1R2CGA7_9CILI|nr:hypothetical protein SteCoe_10041 [Stentor coeruleus]